MCDQPSGSEVPYEDPHEGVMKGPVVVELKGIVPPFN